MWNFQGLIKNKVEFPRVTSKNTVEFPGSLFLALEFPRDQTQFCGISRGWMSFVLSGISSKKMKNSRRFFKKLYPQPPPPSSPVWIFSTIAHFIRPPHSTGSCNPSIMMAAGCYKTKLFKRKNKSKLTYTNSHTWLMYRLMLGRY